MRKLWACSSAFSPWIKCAALVGDFVRGTGYLLCACNLAVLIQQHTDIIGAYSSNNYI